LTGINQGHDPGGEGKGNPRTLPANGGKGSGTWRAATPKNPAEGRTKGKYKTQITKSGKTCFRRGNQIVWFKGPKEGHSGWQLPVDRSA